jgi:hypothetical protein
VPVIPLFTWSTDGTSFNPSAGSGSPFSLADGLMKYFAVTFDADNGASGRSTRFWLSDDGVTWTQQGTTSTQAGVTSIFAGTAPLQIGRSVVSLTPIAGDILYLSLRNGIGPGGTVGGTEVFRFDGATDLHEGSAVNSFTSASGHTVTVNRSGSPSTTVTPLAIDGPTVRTTVRGER